MPLLRKEAGEGDTWVDPKTGLEWVVSPPTTKLEHSWAVKYVKNLNLDGGGWRLPTDTELLGISGSKRPKGLKGKKEWYWSSTAHASIPDNYHTVNFAYDYISFNDGKQRFLVRGVRKAKREPGLRAHLMPLLRKEAGEGDTWVDEKTGLEWEVGLHKMNWQDAMKYAKSLSLDGGGWLLPSPKALKSLKEGEFQRPNRLWTSNHKSEQHEVAHIVTSKGTVYWDYIVGHWRIHQTKRVFMAVRDATLEEITNAKDLNHPKKGFVDIKTGLVWLAPSTWADSDYSISRLIKSPWRIPTAKELKTIAHKLSSSYDYWTADTRKVPIEIAQVGIPSRGDGEFLPTTTVQWFRCVRKAK